MQGNRDATGQRASKRGIVARAGAKVLRLILQGVSARTHAIAGTPPRRPAPFGATAEE